MARKRKIRPRIWREDKNNRLVEIEFERQKFVICLKCLRKLRETIKFNKSMQEHAKWVGQFTGSYRGIYPLSIIAQPAGWEKVVCSKCGAKNVNPNKTENTYQFGGGID